MRFNVFLALMLASPLALAQTPDKEPNVDPESQANQSLGTPAPAPAASSSAPAARTAPVAKDLEADDVIVQEIRTTSTPNPAKAKKPVAAEEEESGTVRDTETESRGSEPIAKHEDAAPAPTAAAPSASGEAMTMKVRPAGKTVEAEVTPAPADIQVRQKPRRVQRGAVAATATKKPAKKTAASALAEKVATSEAAPTADTVMKWLTNGNTRFVKKHFRADGRSPADRTRLEKGEHPHAAILAPSDSRVVPEFIFDQGLGEIYDVRAFGQDLDSATVAALEYAVAKLKVPLVVVMGNSDCAAIRTMVEDKINENGDHVGDGPSSPDIEKVVSDIRPRLKTLKDDPVSPGYEVEATLNADGIARELVKRSDIIREAVEKNELVIKSALYRLNTGKVSFY